MARRTRTDEADRVCALAAALVLSLPCSPLTLEGDERGTVRWTPSGREGRQGDVYVYVHAFGCTRPRFAALSGSSHDATWQAQHTEHVGIRFGDPRVSLTFSGVMQGDSSASGVPSDAPTAGDRSALGCWVESEWGVARMVALSRYRACGFLDDQWSPT